MTTLVTRNLHARARAQGVREFVGLNCPVGNGALVLGSVRDEPHIPTRGERMFWRPVAAHFSAAVRLRDSIRATPTATFHADGRVRDSARGDAALLERLRAAVLLRERARARKRSSSLWPAIIAGQWAIVDRFEANDRRYVVAHRVPAAAAPLHVLTVREQAVLDAAARGEANKAIAIDLAVSEATVSRCLSSGLRKLGCNVAEMLVLQRSEAVPGSVGTRQLAVINGALVPSRVSELTAAERIVLDHAIRGLSAAEIARLRRRSLRTITNQLRSIYEALGVRSRRELLLHTTLR